MRRLRAHPFQLTLLAMALAATAAALIAAAYGFRAFAEVWSHLQWGWLALVVAGQLFAIPAYALAYREVAQIRDGPRLRVPLVARIVVAGFGAFAPRGGFALDKRALHAIGDDERGALIRVLGMGALEWALLAPAAWASAVVLLVAGDHRALSSLLWPWAIAVPVGFALGLWLAAPDRVERIAESAGRIRAGLARGLRGVGILRRLAAGFSNCWGAWVGIALYWTFDLASFYGAARFVALHLNVAELILAYATGYALTRRSMPFGGAGVTEVLLTFALHWVGQPVLPALATVLVYRVLNFGLPTVPALLVRPRLEPLLAAADDGRTPAHAERSHAAAGLG